MKCGRPGPGVRRMQGEVLDMTDCSEYQDQLGRYARPRDVGPTWLSVGDKSLEIIASYPEWAGLQLHSLALPAEYRCVGCGEQRESTVVAVAADRKPVCPMCYARLAHHAALRDLAS